MPRTLDPELQDCLERANPYVEYRIEIAEPDVGQVLRRQDQFLSTPPLVGAMVPANSLSASARGGLILTPSTLALATFSGTGASFDLSPEDPNRRYKGVSWTIDPAFSRATIKSIQAKIQRVAIAGFFFEQDFECQVFQITRTPGVKIKNPGTPQYQSVAFTDYAFAPLLNPAPVLRASAQSWSSNIATLNFDLSNFRLVLENIPGRAVSPDQTGTLPKYLIVIRLAGKPLPGTGHFKWLTDNVASHAVSGVGTFDRVFWAKDSDEAQWTENLSSDVPNLVLNIESYPVSGQGIYLIDQGAAPKAASIGRIEFQRSLPPGTNATIEISTAGSGGPWTAVKHGDMVAVKQQTYHLRTTLTSDTSQRATPEVLAQGVESRILVDVSIEGVPTLPSREIDLPWPKASIPEGKVKVVRTGVRDYLDVGSVLGSTAATSRLEADIFLASRHPSITRDKWFRLERMMVTNRLPSATSEEFTLLSYASRLKRKIPQKVETLNSVHVVASSTTAQVVVNGAAPLPGTTGGGNEYDGKNYYMRVRSTTATTIPVGYVAVIQGSTDTTKLDFSPALPQALVAGDVIEVHSGIFQTQAVSWNNADPADVWWDVLTSLVVIPPERIGSGSLPRGGKPPRVEDIAPGDATTQAKRKITGRLSEEIEGDKVIDVISAILGGVTLEIGGQMVFVQIVPLLDLSGAVTVPLPPPAAVFDLRDFSAPPQTPLGLERRATVVTAKYGVPATSASPDSFPSKATTAVDSDALLWLAQQDLEDYGTGEVPDEISKWLYNTTDEGLYLASVLGAQLVRVASTGLRVFALQMSEKHPGLVPGDVIVIVTDQYTDCDPSTQTSIKGPIAVRGVLVRVGNEGRQLSMFVPGLRDNVQLIAGGAPGSLIGFGSSTDPERSLKDFRVIEETETSITYGWTLGAFVTTVWAGSATFAEPLTTDPWPTVIAAITPLPAGTTSLTVQKPAEGYKTFIQLEPRTDYLLVGTIRRAEVNPQASQAPFVELDDSETSTMGTQWWKITERGFPVVGVQVQTQIGTQPVSDFGPPLRASGASSVVRGGVLGAGEYEHDVALDPSRFSWIMPRINLANGAAPIVLGPFGFDRDKNPNLLSVTLAGTILTILADSDTRSIRVIDKLGTWEYKLDGVSAVIDVSKPGTNAVAGLGTAASSTFTVEARSDPNAYVDGSTLKDTRDIVIGGATAPPPSALWDTPGVSVEAPPIGSAVMIINLKATAAPGSWTVKLYIGLDSPSVDHTADVSPALSAPPTGDTAYSFVTDYVMIHDPPRLMRNMYVKADLLDASSVVVDSRTVRASWFSLPG